MAVISIMAAAIVHIDEGVSDGPDCNAVPIAGIIAKVIAQNILQQRARTGRRGRFGLCEPRGETLLRCQGALNFPGHGGQTSPLIPLSPSRYDCGKARFRIQKFSLDQVSGYLAFRQQVFAALLNPIFADSVLPEPSVIPTSAAR
jgi:hypothetical protein